MTLTPDITISTSCLLPTGQAVRFWFLCPSVVRHAQEEVAGGHPVLDGSRGDLTATVRTRGTFCFISLSHSIIFESLHSALCFMEEQFYTISGLEFRSWIWWRGTAISLWKGEPLSGTFYLYWNFAKGTTAKTQGTTAFAAGAMGYFEACHIPAQSSLHRYILSTVNLIRLLPYTGWHLVIRYHGNGDGGRWASILQWASTASHETHPRHAPS